MEHFQDWLRRRGRRGRDHDVTGDARGEVRHLPAATAAARFGSPS
jgi:hypothetical protein